MGGPFISDGDVLVLAAIPFLCGAVVGAVLVWIF